MRQHTLHELDEALASMDRLDLEELAFRYVKSHNTACITGGAGPDRHADDAAILDRIGLMETAELSAMLGPAAWIGVIAHEFVSGT